MEKILISKLIGKNDAVILEDQIYNLRDILDSFRASIITKTHLAQNEIFLAKTRLSKIVEIIEPMKITLDNLEGYTNSKVFLKRYLESLTSNALELIRAIGSKQEQEFVFYTNTLIDIVLKY
ncbi:MAG: hypothetical protein ACRC41_03790 [Sarcina sp.]